MAGYTCSVGRVSPSANPPAGGISKNRRGYQSGGPYRKNVFLHKTVKFSPAARACVLFIPICIVSTPSPFKGGGGMIRFLDIFKRGMAESQKKGLTKGVGGGGRFSNGDHPNRSPPMQ